MKAIRYAVTFALGTLTLFPAGPLAAQSRSAGSLPPESRANAERMLGDIRYLSDDARGGRGTGDPGLDSAAEYVARRFRESGLVPAGTDGYFQRFVIDSTAPAAAHAGLKAAAVRNVIGMVPGKGRLAGQVVVVGAHYDHLGEGRFGSMTPDSAGVIHNGADDNASGTAAIIEVGRQLVARAARAGESRTILAIAFASEELGNLGSGYYVTHPVRPIDSTSVMLNLDMVGRLANDKLQVFGTATAKELPGLIDSITKSYQLSLAAPGGDCYGSSDHASFCSAKIPSMHFFTGIHQDYHKPSDDWPTINSAGTATVANLVADVAWQLAIRPDSLSFVDIPAPVRQLAGSGYGAYLGTVPDMASSPGGVLLQGVRAGSPAEAAGIKGGDVIVQIGQTEVKNLYDMTAALQEHRPGDVVDITVRRGEERLTMKATLARRGA